VLHCFASVTLKLYPISHCKRYAKKMSFDLQDLMHAGVHISSSAVRHRPLEGDIKTKKPLKKQLLRGRRNSGMAGGAAKELRAMQIYKKQNNHY